MLLKWSTIFNKKGGIANKVADALSSRVEGSADCTIAHITQNFQLVNSWMEEVRSYNNDPEAEEVLEKLSTEGNLGLRNYDSGTSSLLDWRFAKGKGSKYR